MIPVDEVAIQRAIRGDKSVVLDPHEYLIAVHRMAAQGVSIIETADRLGITERRVNRMRQRPLPPAEVVPPVSLPSPDVLDGLAEGAVDLVSKVRDTDPVEVWQKLSGLDRDRLQALTVALAALVPDDRTAAELFAWSDRLVDEVAAS